MKTYQFTATDFECYPKKSERKGYERCSWVLEAEFQSELHRFTKQLPVIARFRRAFHRTTLLLYPHKPFDLILADELEKEYDCAFEINFARVVFEIEKANWEKVYYDLLKCHMYLKSVPTWPSLSCQRIGSTHEGKRPYSIL